MTSPPPPKVLLRSHDANTARALRPLLSTWCDLHLVHDLKSIENLCNLPAGPLSLIVELPPPSPVPCERAVGAKDELTRFLESARHRFPAMRRVVIADPEDLSIAIDGLHSGAVDSVLHRPFDLAGVFTALRVQKTQGAVAASVASIGQ